MSSRDKDRPLYLISVVSEMLRVHPQTLRLYEREGLITPSRTKKQRLYSESDVERINLILQLTRDMGVNKAGVDIILRMRQRMEVLQREMDALISNLEGEVGRQFRDRLKKALREEE